MLRALCSQKHLAAPLALWAAGGLVQTILREGKARLWFCFSGELFSCLFFYFFF